MLLSSKRLRSSSPGHVPSSPLDHISKRRKPSAYPTNNDTYQANTSPASHSIVVDSPRTADCNTLQYSSASHPNTYPQDRSRSQPFQSSQQALPCTPYQPVASSSSTMMTTKTFAMNSTDANAPVNPADATSQSSRSKEHWQTPIGDSWKQRQRRIRPRPSRHAASVNHPPDDFRTPLPSQHGLKLQLNDTEEEEEKEDEEEMSVSSVSHRLPAYRPELEVTQYLEEPRRLSSSSRIDWADQEPPDELNEHDEDEEEEEEEEEDDDDDDDEYDDEDDEESEIKGDSPYAPMNRLLYTLHQQRYPQTPSTSPTAGTTVPTSPCSSPLFAPPTPNLRPTYRPHPLSKQTSSFSSLQPTIRANSSSEVELIVGAGSLSRQKVADQEVIEGRTIEVDGEREREEVERRYEVANRLLGGLVLGRRRGREEVE